MARSERWLVAPKMYRG